LKEIRVLAEDIALEEKLRRFDAALTKLQLTVEAGNGVPNAIFNEFLVAAESYRRDIYPVWHQHSGIQTKPAENLGNNHWRRQCI
jgi:hypothetical protein